jgi:hypothetical protein
MDLIELAKQIEHDPLRKAFILTAVESYSRSVINDPTDWGVNKQVWQSIAKENLTMLAQSRGEK